jgi:hypothetical protein
MHKNFKKRKRNSKILLIAKDTRDKVKRPVTPSTHIHIPRKIRPRWLHKQILSIFKESIQIHHRLPKNRTEGKTPLLSSREYYSDTKTRQRYHKERKLYINLL